ncbi:helix-turn-helix domain-containing protein [Ectothiorhodospira marina]|uniref:HTH-type transcriptional regulator / antitoxin HigA n=1 Tax=Ectothiorhodospira marina TaxID=1396821 RepID=A0A1H7I7Z3_9GAMM|nr:transcriptional regulator [Ectothiorhodospira marina]SEK58673.1 HTH-type transcriptional regulator / antitoxin HigA [Ectothiorhodospira marina]
MTAAAFKDACHSFAKAAAPYLPIRDDAHYEEALALVESLLKEAEDSPSDPLNAVIDLLTHAIQTYEDQDAELAAFEQRALEQPADLAMLRLLMAQHQLGIADLPEIGSKSMVSRVLSGERSLNKSHIKALSRRFDIDPGLFF